MDKYVYPNEATYDEQMIAFGEDRWQIPQILEDLKVNTKEEGLWNMFLPESERGGGLTNVEYAPICEIMGRKSVGLLKFLTVLHLIQEIWN